MPVNLSLSRNAFSKPWLASHAFIRAARSLSRLECETKMRAIRRFPAPPSQPPCDSPPDRLEKLPDARPFRKLQSLRVRILPRQNPAIFFDVDPTSPRERD